MSVKARTSGPTLLLLSVRLLESPATSCHPSFKLESWQCIMHRVVIKVLVNGKGRFKHLILFRTSGSRAVVSPRI